MTRLEALRASAASYLLTPAPGVHRVGWRDISADLFSVGNAVGVSVRGTDPRNFSNVARDMDVEGEPVRDHPEAGPMFAGALDAAEGLLPQILTLIGDRPICGAAHSLGGQILVDLGLLLHLMGRPILDLWGEDPPKSGGPQMVKIMAPVDVHIDRFAGSIVNRWPFERGVHARTPTQIGDWTPSWLEAHGIERMVAWEAAQEAVVA